MLASILTASQAGAGPDFLTSQYLAQSNPTALSVYLTLSSSLEVTGMLLERMRPAQGRPRSFPAPNESQPRGTSNMLDPQVGHDVQCQWVTTQLQVAMPATEILVSTENALWLKRNKKEPVKNIICMHVCMHAHM